MQNTSAFATLGNILEKPTVECDWQGNVCFVNSAAKHLFRLNSKDASFEHVTELLPNAAKLLDMLQTRKPNETGGLMSIVDRAKIPAQTATGNELHLEMSVLGSCNEGKNRLLFILRLLHAENITSRHKLIARFLNQAKIPLSVVDEDGYYIDVNDSYCELFGYAKEELIGQQFSLVIPLEMSTQADRLREEFFEHETEIHAEWVCQTKAGKIITVMATANLLQNPDGRRLQLLTCQDITTHVQSEIRFQKDEAIMHQIFDYAEVGLGLINQSGHFLRANKTLCQLFGYRSEEIQNQPFLILFPEEQKEYAQERFHEAMERGKQEEDNWSLTHPDGTHSTIHSVFRCLTLADGTTCLLATFSNITADKRTKEAFLREKEHAEQALDEQSILLNQISRQMRSLVNPLAGFTDLLKSTTLNPEQEEYGRAIDESCQQLLTVVDDISDYSRYSTDSINSSPLSSVSLIDLLNEAKTHFEKQALAQKLTLTTQIEKGVPPDVSTVPIQLRKILKNILSFCLAYTTGSEIKIEFSTTNQKPVGKEQYLALKITDPGLDIPELKLRKAFTPFALLITHTPMLATTGMLLPISRMLSQQLEGSLSCQHNDTGGTRFTLTWPVQTPITQQTLEKDSSFSKALRIVCAEDSPSNRSVIKALIGKLGHQIVFTTHGEELLQKLEKENFDCLLLDLHLPDMDGYEITTHIRNGAPTDRNQAIPIIAITAHDTAEVHQKCIEVGMTAYLPKPISREKLKELLDQLGKKSES